MINALESFFNYEKILLLLGTALFLVLLMGLILFIIRREKITQYYLLAFMIPVLMIGYPSIQRFSFLNELFVLEQKVEYMETHPKDEAARKALKESLEKLGNRPISNPEKLAILAQAHFYLKEYKMAKRYANSALDQQPENLKARALKRELDKE